MLSKTGMMKRNHLDASHNSEHAFRIKTINQYLPTLEMRKKVYKQDITNICPRCTQIETLDHIWECKDTIRDYPQLLKSTEQNLANNINQSIDWRKLELDQSLIRKIKNALNITNHQFLKTKEAKGIITENLKRKITTGNTQFNVKTKYHLIYVLDAWLRAFYSIIWTKRTRLVKTISRDYLDNKSIFTNKEKRMLAGSPAVNRKLQNKKIQEMRDQKRFKLTHDAPKYFTIHERNMLIKTPKATRKRPREKDMIFTIHERNLFRKSPKRKKPPDPPEKSRRGRRNNL
jgi:hypothetical protein